MCLTVSGAMKHKRLKKRFYRPINLPSNLIFNLGKTDAINVNLRN
jgi:hypothetical protein